MKKHILKENYERFFGETSLNEAAKGLRGYQKYVEKKKGELLFYAESPDGEVFMGLEKTKNGKFDLGMGTMGMIGPTGGQTSALDGPDEYSSLSQAKSGIKNQMSLAKQGYAHPDEKKFSWKVVVDKLNESLNEYSISDSDNLWDSNGVEDRQVILKALKKDSKIMKKIGPKPYWDDIDLVADNDEGDTVASLRRNMTLKNLKQAILKWRG